MLAHLTQVNNSESHALQRTAMHCNNSLQLTKVFWMGHVRAAQAMQALCSQNTTRRAALD